MIIGVGHDVVEIDRMRRILDKREGERFMERVLHFAELEYARGKQGRLAEFIAGRFAAKEAVVKALGCGIGAVVGFGDIAIMPDALGKPCCSLSEAAWERLGYRSSDVRVHVSISHERSIASAFAMVERL
jgi:holo-[acyl-carrier protein] synthase